MKLFLDSTNIDEIEKAADMGILDGVTTNPTLVYKEKSDQSFKEIIGQICSLVDGPVSAEVISIDAQGMLDEAYELNKIAKNVYIKIPMTREGIKAVSILSDKNFKTNVTLCFSANQAWLAAKAGATLISPFVGRIDDDMSDKNENSWDGAFYTQTGMDLVRDIRTIYDNYGYNTEILVASIRGTGHVTEAALAGADIVTLPYKVFDQLFDHHLTDRGLEQFLEDWNKIERKE